MKVSQRGAGVVMSRIDVLAADGPGSIIGLSELGSWAYSVRSIPAVLCPLQVSAAQKATAEVIEVALFAHQCTHEQHTHVHSTYCC